MTNNSTVLALKYRPVNFDQLIGQELIGETIYNSIKLNKVPNAYLLTGIRGTGKTSIARIIAKVLNCKNGFENLCKDNFCENCEAITNSNHIDIFELDAASQSSVENTRELIEFSRYAPTSSKYKIYILDECHMLSKQAWASLLKTLEEPPEYLKFIFATTEIRKVPITIVSRCQRFDLSRIKSDQLFQFIKKITEKEKGRVTDEALKLIVKLSEGSVRDALSLLDRGLLSSTMPRVVTNAKIALIDREIEIKKTEIDANIQIKTPDQMQGFLDQDDQLPYVYGKGNQYKANNANAAWLASNVG